MSGFSFTAIGEPAPQGSKRGFVNKSTGRVALVESSKKVKPWRQDILEAAPVLAEPLDGPIVAYAVFTVRKPQSVRKGVTYPSTKPDLSKLVRAVEDAITDKGCWRDDARVVGYRRLWKVWPGHDTDALAVPGVLFAAVEMKEGWELELRAQVFKARGMHRNAFAVV